MKALALLAFAGLAAADQSYTYWIEPCTRSETRCEDRDAELAEWALKAWEKAAGGLLKFQRVPDRHSALIRIHWVAAGGGKYGEARWFSSNGRRGAEVYVAPDLNQLGPDIAGAARCDPLFRQAVVYLTCLHETGHAIGLEHTAAWEDIMYSFAHGGDIREYFARYRRRLTSREDIARHSGISNADRSRLLAVLGQ